MCVDVYVYAHVQMCAFLHAHVWKSEDNFWESLLTFHFVVLSDQILVARLGGKFPYPLNHLAGTLIDCFEPHFSMLLSRKDG